ncbi:MAG: cobalamin-dependent protein [Nocardioides sp.]|nr:cobalamin-dependent protein [Nocardioides sp.]
MRTELAAEIGRVRDAVADSVTATFLARHPDWIERYGDGATKHGVQDARHHIDFLQAAVELGDPASFRDYALWCRDLLSARGIGVVFLVENLEAIRDEMASRLSPAAAGAVSLAAREGLEALAAGQESPRAKEGPLSPACRLYVAASVSGRREDALAIVREFVRAGASPVDVYIDIFQSALHEVGRRWQTTGLTIAEEHMATATTQFILSVLQEEHPRATSNKRTAVVTGVLDERHVVGASIVANVLDAEGWDVRFLGSDLPHDAIVSAIDQYGADLVAISVTMSGRVGDARDLIAQVRRSSAHPPRIIVGGAAFLSDPQLWRTIGADGFAADARSVAELARG